MGMGVMAYCSGDPQKWVLKGRGGLMGGPPKTTGNSKGYDSSKLTVRTIGGCNLRDVYELQTELLSKNLSSATMIGNPIIYYTHVMVT